MNAQSRQAVLLTAAVGLVGLATDQAARAAGWEFPSPGFLVGELIWNASAIGALVWAIRRLSNSGVTAEALGYRRRADARQPYPIVAAVGVAVASVVASAAVGASATNGTNYGTVHHAGLVIGLAELLVRYPLTVFAEEALFRGWLQPRLGRFGPVWSALLWAGYHLQQVRTIPSLVLFGLGLGFVRWWLGDVRLTSVFHYASDAAFFIATYM